jgi:molybdenum cofactor synthesis domain-containing protein
MMVLVMTAKAELISVGEELLIGKTENTNASWIARRLTSLGLRLRRITTVGDVVEEIASCVAEALERKPRFLILTGGLGPTFDDKTLEGIAASLNTSLEIDPKALQMVEAKYHQYVRDGRMANFEMTPARVKMAKLPSGSEPLPNPVGTAPGVKVENEGTTIFALPGVPSEMKAIFEESLVPSFKEAVGNVTFFETSLHVSGIGESALAPLIDKVMHDNPYVYVKSHPQDAEKAFHIELHLSTTAEDAKTARARIGNVVSEITGLITEKNGVVNTNSSG